MSKPAYYLLITFVILLMISMLTIFFIETNRKENDPLCKRDGYIFTGKTLVRKYDCENDV